MAEETTATAPDPGAGFAGLMAGAAQAAAPPADPEAPFGWTTDKDGTRRPKKTPGRPRKPPTIEELQAERDAAAVEGKVVEPPGDRAPSRPGRRRRRKTDPGKPEKPEEGIPQHRPGVITKGVNKLYRRAGRMVRAVDPVVGAAIIAATENTAGEGEPDDSVGACWDELARANPRVRKFLLRLIAGGALGSLVWAHLPIAAAILMKDGIRKYIPFAKLIAALADDEDREDAGDGMPGGLAGLLGGLQPDDLAAMQGMMQGFMGQMAASAAAAETAPEPARHGRVP